MKQITSLIALLTLVVLVPLPAVGSEALIGTWNGLIEVDPGKVEVEFQISVVSQKEGDIWFPTQGSTRHPLIQLDLAKDQISFATIDAQGVISSFTGEISGDGIHGSVSEGEMVRPFTLKQISLDPEAAPGPRPALNVLATGVGELRQAFNKDRDKVRVLAILSPTCGMCRMGARMIENYLFDRVDDPRLSVYVVWEPELPEDNEAAAREATFFLASERATHFWSEDRSAGRAYQAPLGTESPAWDVFLVFDRGTTWEEDVAPAAEFYMHNLRGSLPEEDLLDATKLAEKIDTLLTHEPTSTN